MAEQPQNDPFFDRHTDVDEILVDIRKHLATIVNQEGVADVQNPNDVANVVAEYVSIPPTGARAALPPGTITFDFESGKVTHEKRPERTSQSSAGELNIDLRTVDEVFGDMGNDAINAFRTLLVEADTSLKLSLNRSNPGGWININPSQSVALQSQGFNSFQIYNEHGTVFTGFASTVKEAERTAATHPSTSRRGYRSGTLDGWTEVWFYPYGMDETLSGTGLDHEDFKEYPVEAWPYDEVTITVENESGNGNALDAIVSVADTDHRLWYQAGDSIFEDTGAYLADGDHYTFNVDGQHKWVKLAVQNETNGQTIDVQAQLHAGGA